MSEKGHIYIETQHIPVWVKTLWGIQEDIINSHVNEGYTRHNKFLSGWIHSSEERIHVVTSEIQRVSSHPPLHLLDSHVMGKIYQDQTGLSLSLPFHTFMYYALNYPQQVRWWYWTGGWVTWERLLVDWCKGPRWPSARQAGPHVEKY